MMDGILLINKEQGWTSHDVVAKTRGLFHLKKVGHTGTLDPMATGVLPICLGKATRIAEYVSENKKSYIAEAEVGYSTTTYDTTGKKVNFGREIFNLKNLVYIVRQFSGEIEQIPPMYSAIKIKGKKLYEYAREGIEIDRKARKVFIYKIELLDYNNQSFKLYIECSSGTYIRSLIHDIGVKLGTFATMSSLVRTSVGNFCLDKTHTITQIEEMSLEERKKILLPIDRGVESFPTLQLNSSQAQAALNGRKIQIQGLKSEQLYKVYSSDLFIGLGYCVKISGLDYLQMKKVFK